MATIQGTQCYCPQELAAFAAGAVSEERFDSIAAHVDTCTSCQATVCGLDEQGDSFVQGFQQMPDGHSEGESACQSVVQRLIERYSDASPERLSAKELAAIDVPSQIGGYRVLQRLGAGG